MSFCVAVEGGFLAKPLVANLTLVRLEAEVQPLVLCSRPFLCEAFLAVSTLEALFSGVSAAVGKQVALHLEGFRAFLTHVRSVVFMHSLNVSVQIRFGDKVQITGLTAKLG